MKIVFFDSTLEIFIASLETPALAKVLRTVDLLEMFGNQLGAPHSKKVDRDLFELRVRGKQEVRIFYAFVKDGIVLVHGFLKKSQRIPRKEIMVASQKLAALLDKHNI